VDDRSPELWRRQAADYRRRAENSRYAVVRLYFLKMAARCDHMAEQIDESGADARAHAHKHRESE
jgi:hypothetical protein